MAVSIEAVRREIAEALAKAAHIPIKYLHGTRPTLHVVKVTPRCPSFRGEKA